MKTFRDFLVSALTGGKYHAIQDETSMDAMLRLIVLNITYTIASVSIISFGVLDMQNGNINMGLIQLILGFMIFVNLLLLRTELPFMVGGIIVTAIFGAFCGVILFAKYDLRGLDVIWLFSFPLMSIFTLGLYVGLVPALLLFLVTVFRTFFTGYANFDYTLSEASLICGVYFFVLLLTAVYEYVRSMKDKWLIQQNNYLNMVFDNSPDIIILLDKDIQMLYCARVFLEKTKIVSFEKIRKKNYRHVFSMFTNVDQLHDIIASFVDSREKRTPVTFEQVLDFGNDGQLRHYKIHFTPMYDNYDVFQGAFILFHDVTEIMEAKERTEQASQAKSNFLANMSHEIRTPLNAIIGMTVIAKESNLPERKDYCLDKIESASVHLLGIINNILDMSKIEENKFELSNTEFDFSAMIKRVISIFEFQLGEKKQKLKVEQDPLIPEKIITDAQRLAQVITNLLGNAIKFTPEEGVITLSVQRIALEDDNFCKLEIRITDTGIGIPKEKQDNLFDSFVQVDSSIARKYGGTGLGLAISRKIVELMQGKIRVESEKNKGASFIFTISAGIPGIAAADAAGDTEKPVPMEQIDFSGKKILLSEDVEINREIVITVLEPLGLNILVAEDGKMAFDIFCENADSIDLVFMDLHMPGIDGYEATKLIRAFDHPRAKEVPIIAMTANVFKEDIDRCLSIGMNGHIGKPLDFDVVMAILRKYLS